MKSFLGGTLLPLLTLLVLTGSQVLAALPALAGEPGSANPATDARPFERTEQRTACAQYDPLRRPLFGDLHVHSSYSFDSYTSGQRNDPWGAYEYAKGGTILIPDQDGESTVEARIRRPLDFASVTDHAEYLGEVNICTTDPWTLAYWTPLCLLTRSDNFYLRLVSAGEWVKIGVTSEDSQKERSPTPLYFPF